MSVPGPFPATSHIIGTYKSRNDLRLEGSLSHVAHIYHVLRFVLYSLLYKFGVVKEADRSGQFLSSDILGQHIGFYALGSRGLMRTLSSSNPLKLLQSVVHACNEEDEDVLSYPS